MPSREEIETALRLDPGPLNTLIRWRGLKEFQLALQNSLQEGSTTIFPTDLRLNKDYSRTTRHVVYAMVPPITRILPAIGNVLGPLLRVSRLRLRRTENLLRADVTAEWVAQVRQLVHDITARVPQIDNDEAFERARRNLIGLMVGRKVAAQLDFTIEILELFENTEPDTFEEIDKIMAREIGSLPFVPPMTESANRERVIQKARIVVALFRQQLPTFSLNLRTLTTEILRTVNVNLIEFELLVMNINRQSTRNLLMLITAKIREIERNHPDPSDIDRQMGVLDVGPPTGIVDPLLDEFLGKYLEYRLHSLGQWRDQLIE